MRTIILLVYIATLAPLSGCGDNKAQVVAPEHKAKAADMCKRDKGVKQIVDVYGTNFTAECNSGVIVTGIANMQ